MRFEGYSNAVSSRRVRSINQRRRNVFQCFHKPFNVLTFPLARGVLSIKALRCKYQQRSRRNEDEIMRNQRSRRNEDEIMRNQRSQRNEDEITRNPWYKKIDNFIRGQSRKSTHETGESTYGESRPKVLLQLFNYLTEKHGMDSNSIFMDIGSGLGKVLLFFRQMSSCPRTLVGIDIQSNRVEASVRAIKDSAQDKYQLKNDGVKVLAADALHLTSLV